MELTREQILAYRRRVGALDRRLPSGPESLRRAAWAGLQDSMPRAALLSIHARVEGTRPTAWKDPSLVQIWGPRYSAYVVAAPDVAVFTLGRLPDDAKGRRFANDTADRLEDFLNGRASTYGEAGRGIGVHPNALRYGAPTGRILIRWDGARQPTVSTVPAPAVDPAAARLELARRYVHVFGPTTPEAFAQWAGIRPRRARTAFDQLGDELRQVRTPMGDASLLSSDETALTAEPQEPAAARLLPSGDAYFLLHGRDRELLVPDADHRSRLWTPRVWPGAVLVEGEVAGIWRRAQEKVTVEPWRRFSAAEREAIEAEAAVMPLPGVAGRITVRWDETR